MPKANEKLHINDTVLFKQVASVLGKGRALEELTRAYRSCPTVWYWYKPLEKAFVWGASVQGHDYWKDIHDAINK